MKKLVFYLFFLFVYLSCNAQNLPPNFNLVSNGEFSISSNFMFLDTNINNSSCWTRAGKREPSVYPSTGDFYYDTTLQTLFNDSLDDFNSLELITDNIPFKVSTQKVVDTNSQFIRSQYAITKLLEPLLANTVYFFRMKIWGVKISPTAYLQNDTSDKYSNYNNNFKNIGVHFSINQIKNYTTDILKYTPQINFKNWTFPTRDTFGFITLSGSFIANGGEQYMTLGNFDYFANYIFSDFFPNAYMASSNGYDTVLIEDWKHITSLSLVRDTTQPMISLAHFSLGNDTVICPNDTLTLGGEPYFFHYWWNTGDTTRFINVTQPGTYWCTVDFGCSTYTDTIHISPPKTIQPFDIKDTAICNIDYIQRAPSGYNSYLWSDNSTTDSLHIITPGSYWVKVDNGCGQHFTDTFTVAIADTTKPPSPLLDIFLCNENGETVTAASGFESYLWSTGDTTQSILIKQLGTYTLEAVNNCGAIYRDTFLVFNAVTPINLGNDTMICNAAMNLTLSIPSSLSNILWSNGATTNSIIVSTPGTYYVTATSPCGVLSDTILITLCQPEIETINLSSQAICVGECIAVSAQYSNYPQSWLWSFDGGTPSTYNGQNPTQICYNTVGNYNITLIASNAGGSDTITSSINVFPIPQGRFEDTTINVPYKTPLHLQACAEGQHVYWYRGDTLVCNDCPVYSFEAKDWQSVYYCIVENAEGICSDTCIYKVSVYDIPSDVYLPTAFSPNGDGLNEAFKVLTDNPNFLLHSLSVYNRWGQRIYYGTNDKGGWDGTYKGEKVEVGVYFWSLKYRMLGVDKDFFFRKGDVTVVR